MKLRATLFGQNDDLFDKPLIELDVASDTAELCKVDGFVKVKRVVEGTILNTSEYWSRFQSIWGELNDKPRIIDGRPCFEVKHLQVDHDCYAFDSGICINNDSVRLILLEEIGTDSSCDRITVDEYYTIVSTRNQKMEVRLSRWREGQITGNDGRKLAGAAIIDDARLDALLTEDVESIKQKLLFGVAGISLRTNSASTWTHPIDDE